MITAIRAGQIILTLSESDYAELMVDLGFAMGAARRAGDIALANSVVRLLNEMNAGQPGYWPVSLAKEDK